ncbi:hypothetical protein A2763_00560 [Candidatus Kaiserbacteria bacterium RIFCSPHIGHO2_01_FULL_54_36]|uniref:Uncharacterized protein n=1 Tax=Candidatus Kaiserbacteria bacterium RIFCSPHIGHO2_01_FULL_54_36 TaxID=1798482 RepID=A0A1F6CLR4_9BACT|nr:MAG: hypothetical protein A2763_00560 [Candidatus Kaiserbacteria bacterium RIFCSPHIGHO2_01_FULL_54_36]OGG75345.1 MAG: hypothetical protein A3A41_01680 [Candidatus Kaiserbacteria bacterium RIFCSPLOWO2_01_FULL_54_22]
MYDYKTILGIVAVAIGLISYVPYYRDILRGSTKPHPFSWFSFALMMGITFFAQVFTGAGAGAWVTGISAVAVLGIALLSLSKGDKEVTIFDWICFSGAVLGIILWRATNDPLVAVIIVVIADTIAFMPTFRKAYIRPKEETMSLFVLSAAKYVVSLLALSTFSATTALFPAVLVASNLALVLLLIVRRRQLAPSRGV